MRRFAVTGSTGRLGSRIASGLSQLGVDQRLVVRNPAKAPSLPGTHVTTAEYGDRAAVRTALTGAHTVFMVSAAETADRVQQHLTFIDAAVDVGVQRIVYVSFFGASPTASFTLARDHWATVEHLRSVGVAHTILRDNIYAETSMPTSRRTFLAPMGTSVDQRATGGLRAWPRPTLLRLRLRP